MIVTWSLHDNDHVRIQSIFPLILYDHLNSLFFWLKEQQMPVSVGTGLNNYTQEKGINLKKTNISIGIASE